MLMGSILSVAMLHSICQYLVTDITLLNSALLHVKRACEATINKYGVGSCGPRGFYGTIDVHLDLEKRIADFMQTQESIIYAYDLATVPSILPAFANAKDLIICDEVCRVLNATADHSLLLTKPSVMQPAASCCRLQITMHKLC